MKRRKPFTYKEFKNIYSKVPRLCVDMILKTEKGILLLKRTGFGWENQWHLPGGTVLYREKLTDALKRIAKEEVDIDIAVGKLIGYTEFFSEEKERGFGYSVTLVFQVEAKNSKFGSKDKSDKFKFFKTLPKNTVKEHKKFLNSYLKQL